MDSTEKVKSRWTRSFFTALDRKNNEEKFICDICDKEVNSPSNLALHRSTHVIERPYKCETCQTSFHTQGKRLQVWSLLGHLAATTISPYFCLAPPLSIRRRSFTKAYPKLDPWKPCCYDTILRYSLIGQSQAIQMHGVRHSISKARAPGQASEI